MTVYYAGEKIGEEEIALPQAGSVFGIDPKLFTDRKAPSKVLFDPTAGSIVELGPAE